MVEPVAVAGPVAYLTGEYPRATDTFIQREVAALRGHGLKIETCSIRRTGAEHHVGEQQRSEAARTFHVLEAAARPLTSLKAHLAALRDPGRYFRGLRLAWRTSPDGIKGHVYNLIYFAEAVVLARHMRSRGVVHLHNHIAKSSCTVAMLASEVSGIPFSFTMHGPDIFFEPYHWRLDEKIARAAFVACISHFCRSQGMLFSSAVHWPRLHIVHCGVDPALYDAPRGAGAKRLLFVGRLAAVKGVPVLFKALKRVAVDHPDLRLTLVGDGPERAALEAECRAMGLSDVVEFAGYRGQAEVAQALLETDVLVLPSFAEGLPVVLMEALAARVPVIATRIAGVSELVEDGVSGRLVAPGDPLALEQALRALLEAPTEARNAMGTAGRERVVAEFDSVVEAGKLAHLIAASAKGAA
ncbi:glycosyltransferase [Hydrogenophaga sp.]|uniref:glycosyltransferase n=1 Tax=Hydrogenophaga sp. TaxID=1904254 RepID=UPI003F7208B9